MNRKKIIFFGILFLIIYILASTNTVEAILISITYIATLILVQLISFFSDNYFETKFSFKLLKVSGVAVILGFLSFNIYKKYNAKTAENIIVKIENYKNQNGRYPKNDSEIKLPTSINGIYFEKYEYYAEKKTNYETYILKYFDGFWDTKVYVSNERKWYIDD